MLESPQVRRIIVMVTRSWKLEGPKSILPSDFFDQKAKKLPKFMQIWMVVSKIMHHQFLTSKRPKKCFFFWKLPKKSVHFPDMRPTIHTTPGLNVCTICIRTIWDGLVWFGMVCF